MIMFSLPQARPLQFLTDFLTRWEEKETEEAAGQGFSQERLSRIPAPPQVCVLPAFRQERSSTSLCLQLMSLSRQSWTGEVRWLESCTRASVFT